MIISQRCEQNPNPSEPVVQLITPDERIKIVFIIFRVLEVIEFANLDDEETLVSCLQTLQHLTEDSDDTFIQNLC